MVGPWCVEHPPARALFDRAAEILGYDLSAVCAEGPAGRLNTTAVSQPAILVTSLALLEVLRGRGEPALDAASITAGLSLGEYTALVFAGALGFDDAVRLVDVRGRAMQECAEQRPGAMVAVLGLERAQVAALCDEAREDDVLGVANVLCPGNVVASGSAAACRRLESAAAAAGAMKCVPLEVAGAFHTALMEPAVARLSEALAATEIRRPRIPVVSNVDARPHDDPAEIRQLLARQVVGVVEWQASVEHLLATGVRTVWEVGPGRVLRGLMKRIDRSVACHGVLD
ncbi:MAG: [acyl-carrier-protein] S-malonyltransferase [Planctomycetia bacterium]|nr:[acyl-carrier-protein] S-malonyltransferase [Planctomycetia bacterium]